jgi:hypothetical protein
MGANTDVTERKLAELEVLRVKVDLAGVYKISASFGASPSCGMLCR